MADWYVKRGEKVLGPFSASKLKSFADMGKLQGHDLVRKSVTGQFYSAEEVKGLFIEDAIDEDYGFQNLDKIDVSAGERVYEAAQKTESQRPRKKRRNPKLSAHDDGYTSGARTQAMLLGAILVAVSGIRIMIAVVYILLFLGVMPQLFSLQQEDLRQSELSQEELTTVIDNLYLFIGREILETVANVVIIAAGIQLYRCTSYIFVWVGIVLFSFINVLTYLGFGSFECLNIFFIPIGIWAAVALSMPELKQEFSNT